MTQYSSMTQYLDFRPMPNKTYTLQKISFPQERNLNCVGLFARWLDGPPKLALNSSTWTLPGASKIDLCTYFNCFNFRKWRDLTDLQNISFRIAGTGTVRLTIQFFKTNCLAVKIFDSEITLSPTGANYPLGDDFFGLDGDFLAIELQTGDAPITIFEAGWTTSDRPRREISLAAVIVTFRREEMARNAIAKFRETIIPQSEWGAIRLFVVDNGDTLEAVDDAGVKIIKSPNLGGCGGFTRGLLEAKDAGQYSHVLFMDDDASCEPESIWLAMSLAARLKDDQAAIAGSMLFADRPTIQFEKSATFNRNGIQRKNENFDLASPNWLLINDYADDTNYGGFWFLMFPLHAVKQLPFPFFVRGDDVDFCIGNEFKIITLNGIGTWCENFAYKMSPQIEYLAMRSWMALALTYGDKKMTVRTLRNCVNQAIAHGQRFDYDSMEAVTDALEDVAKGPAFFATEKSPIPYFDKFKQTRKSIKNTLETFDDIDEPIYGGARKFEILDILTLRGLIFPKAFVKDRSVYARIAWAVKSNTLLMHKRSIFGFGTKYSIYTRNDRDFRSKMLRLMRLYFIMRLHINKLRDEYSENSAKYRSESYWRSSLQLNVETKDKKHISVF